MFMLWLYGDDTYDESDVPEASRFLIPYINTFITQFPSHPRQKEQRIVVVSGGTHPYSDSYGFFMMQETAYVDFEASPHTRGL